MATILTDSSGPAGKYNTTNTSGDSIQWSTGASRRIASNYAQSNGFGSAGCNESGKHDNDEKALYHGLKSAYRMGRPYDGKEYGTADPQHETAARIAANVAIAYFEATGAEYDREESFEYLRENIVGDPRTVDRILSVFGLAETELDRGLASSDDFESGIRQAWEQVDGKWHHDDAARTALAAAEGYLGEELYDTA